MTDDEQIHRDLAARIHERHKRWIEDSFALFEMAELPHAVAIHAILVSLVKETVVGLHAANYSPEQAGGLIESVLRNFMRQCEAEAD